MSHKHFLKRLTLLSIPIRLALMLALLMATLGILPAPVARAADQVVTNTNDSGDGSLRQAITDVGAGETITFNLTGTGPFTITLESALPEITEDLTITGPGADLLAISGDGQYRVFNISSGTVTISGLTITEGHTDMDGGAGFYIVSPAVVTITNCAITNNTLPSDGELLGAGIYSDGDLTLERSTVSGNNAADNSGGGLYLVMPSSVSVIINSTISGNSADFSAGICVDGDGGMATAVITNCTVTNNTATGEYDGGGIQ